MYRFINNEISLQKREIVAGWQKVYASLLSYIIRKSMPLERLNLGSYYEMQKYYRNAGEALLVIHFICAKRTGKNSSLNLGNDVNFGKWIKQIQEQKKNDEINIAMLSLGFLNLHNCTLKKIDFSGANLINSSFKNSDLSYANFISADLTNTDFTDAQIDYIMVNSHQSAIIKCSGGELKGVPIIVDKNIRKYT